MQCDVELAGIFVEKDIIRHYGKFEKVKRSVRYDGYLATAGKLIRRIFDRNKIAPILAEVEESRAELEKAASSNLIPFHIVENYHSPEAIGLMRSTNADLAVIYGTNIIRESVFSLPKMGSINLHQGLAPYYRGGPPIFWELYNNEVEVGLTVHYVAAKVDSGDIILQERLPLKYDHNTYGLDYESFISDFSDQLRERCAQMIADAVKLIASGTVKPKPQDANVGKRYRLPVKAEKDELRRRLRKRQQQTADAWKGSQAEIG
jgi:methionyl-tRNA formyltransferase